MADGGGRPWRSQPAGLGAGEAEAEGEGEGQLSAAAGAVDALLSHSQPAHADDLLLASQMSSPSTQPSVEAWLVRRMTRVRVRAGAVEGGAGAGVGAGAGRVLAAVAEAAHALSYRTRLLHDNLMAIECDSEVKMRAWVSRGGGGAAGGGGALLEFRRSRGCGLEFKRRYLQLRQRLRHVLEEEN
ncbi:unnamed protein product [Diatraea saccharalis]|uniref:Uncharacterized protein n=1 Tax=Diatraea saccharalis TaxID=40085 RepID=A0A9N9QXK4_9NEOP|nr:unnamed protein product [Diatraea saccharalis]